MTEKTCSICQRPFEEYGNAAWPVNDGRCCNECDWVVVVPARMRLAPGALGTYAQIQESLTKARTLFDRSKNDGTVPTSD
jgi:hypothetical protein